MEVQVGKEESVTVIRQRMARNPAKEQKSGLPIDDESALPIDDESVLPIHDESVLYKVMDIFCSISTTSIAKFLCVLVTIGSLVYEFYPLTDSYFSNKHNLLNQYFVKLAWGWTMALHTPFIVLSGLRSPSSSNFSQILKGLIRVLVVGTAVWYFWVEIVFHSVMQVTGACVGDENLTDVRTCFKAGFLWNGFDISGHCFLLIYSALLIHEELRIVKTKIVDLSTNCNTGLNNITIIADVNISDHSLVEFLRKAFTMLVILLELLWMLMVMMTSIYFHVWSHKLIGTLIALMSWHCTYNIWYKAKFSPGL